jgi:hypothetical protein
VDGIDYNSKIPIVPRDQTLISDHIRDKGGQGTRPQYYRQQPPAEQPVEEEETQTPEENGKPKHLIDIKV